MLDLITDTLQPIIVEALLTLILGAIAWLMACLLMASSALPPTKP